MKNRVINIVLVVFFAMVRIAFSDTAETEPNDNINDSWVKTITTMGTYTGTLGGDNCDIWKIYFPSHGEIHAYFSITPYNSGIFYLDLYESEDDYHCGYPDESGIIYCGSEESFTYTLQSNRYYCLSAAAWSSGYWCNYRIVLSGDASLPVELVSFRAFYETINGITLAWVTESEVDNLGFILEKTDSNPKFWQEIASYRTNDALLGKGNTSTRTEYSFSDQYVEPGKAYYYRISDVSTEGTVTIHSPIYIELNELPKETVLEMAYPNPFNPQTYIAYHLAEATHVNISVFDILGRSVKKLHNGRQLAGSYHLYWNGTDENGARSPSGEYIIRMQTEKVTQIQKVMLMK